MTKLFMRFTLENLTDQPNHVLITMVNGVPLEPAVDIVLEPRSERTVEATLKGRFRPGKRCVVLLDGYRIKPVQDQEAGP